MSKLLSKAKSSKLSNISTDDKAKKYKKSSVNQVIQRIPRSYKLDQDVLNILKDIQERVNNISTKKVSESRLIRALIFLSKEFDEKRVLQAAKEVW